MAPTEVWLSLLRAAQLGHDMVVPSDGARSAAAAFHIDLATRVVEFVEDDRLPEQRRAISKIPLVATNKHRQDEQSTAVRYEMCWRTTRCSSSSNQRSDDAVIAALRLAALVEDVQVIHAARPSVYAFSTVRPGPWNGNGRNGVMPR